MISLSTGERNAAKLIKIHRCRKPVDDKVCDLPDEIICNYILSHLAAVVIDQPMFCRTNEVVVSNMGRNTFSVDSYRAARTSYGVNMNKGVTMKAEAAIHFP